MIIHQLLLVLMIIIDTINANDNINIDPINTSNINSSTINTNIISSTDLPENILSNDEYKGNTDENNDNILILNSQRRYTVL